MLKPVKLAVLRALQASGVSSVVMNSHWRQQRLLILCYHGVAIEDEHLWRPLLYIRAETLQQRFESLKKRQFSVLSLGEGLRRLRDDTLPPRGICLTFDDGGYDFFRQAYPLLKKYEFPATVYQTTYYTLLERPVFNLICSYMLWMRRNKVIPDGESVGLAGPLDLRTGEGRFAIVRRLIESCEREGRTGLQKDELAAQLARLLNIDYESLKAKRILQVMNGRELEEIARNGIDVQLHTHRHNTPVDEALFRKEIEDNRATIRRFTGAEPVHFCYPSGVYQPAFLPWLRSEHVASATTCDAGLAERQSESLMLPRYVDHEHRAQIEFDSWTAGVGDLLAVRRKSVQKHIQVQK